MGTISTSVGGVVAENPLSSLDTLSIRTLYSSVFMMPPAPTSCSLELLSTSLSASCDSRKSDMDMTLTCSRPYLALKPRTRDDLRASALEPCVPVCGSLEVRRDLSR